MKNLWREPKTDYDDLLMPQATKRGYIRCPIGGAFDASYPSSVYRRGRVQEGGAVTPTITTAGSENIYILLTNMIKKDKKTSERVARPTGKGWIYDEENEVWFRVRKLTPIECFRLMGVREDYIHLLQTKGENDKYVISKNQQYKMAGNSIVVDVLDEIFENMFYPKDEWLTKEQVRNMEGMIQLTLF